MKIYSTKYALSAGIMEHEAEETSVEGMVRIGALYNCLHGEGREWHRTRESAVARAEEMRKAKIESLRKSLANFEAMRFS